MWQYDESDYNGVGYISLDGVDMFQGTDAHTCGEYARSIVKMLNKKQDVDNSLRAIVTLCNLPLDGLPVGIVDAIRDIAQEAL